jgi:hypothetical protein
VLWLLRRWHILRCQLTSGLMTSEASVSHLSLEQEECKITFFKESQKIGTRKIIFKKNSFVIYMSLRASSLARLASYGQHDSDIPLVIPRSEKIEMKPPYMCPGCSNHTYNNNMINMCRVR